MLDTKKAIKYSSISIAAVFCTLLALRSVDYLMRYGLNEDYRLFMSIDVGMRSEDVVAILGVPDQKHRSGTPPDDYCVKGWRCDRRPITGELYVYIGSEPIAYVFVNKVGMVEHVYVIGS